MTVDGTEYLRDGHQSMGFTASAPTGNDPQLHRHVGGSAGRASPFGFFVPSGSFRAGGIRPLGLPADVSFPPTSTDASQASLRGMQVSTSAPKFGSGESTNPARFQGQESGESSAPLPPGRPI